MAAKGTWGARGTSGSEDQQQPHTRANSNPPVMPPGPCRDFGSALRKAEQFAPTEAQEHRSAELYPLTPEQELNAIYSLPPLSKKRKALSGKALAAFFNYCFMQHPKEKKKK